MSDWPIRKHTDPQALKALAHPLRLKILEELALRGPMTATAVAERIGDSAANCSWHLRQLAKYGYVDDAEGGTGRQRPWKYVPVGNRWGSPDDSPELAAAGDAVAEIMLDREVAQLRAWNGGQRHKDPTWTEAAFILQSVAWLTPEELTEAAEAVRAVVLRHMDRFADPSLRPEGARPVRMLAWGIPTD
ncbi:MAG: helix-turn-helix domain-containing protein [Hamadaea sp.]|nr:helix-turn-helix domain-containing protein [Hamadaea sp.]